MDSWLKTCIVPSCGNTNHTRPDLIHLTVPIQPNRRKAWEQALDVTLTKTRYYTCCEVHFDLPNDAVNWCYYKMMGTRIELKPNVVPHLNITPTEDELHSQLTISDRKMKVENLNNIDYGSSGPIFIDAGEVCEVCLP